MSAPAAPGGPLVDAVGAAAYTVPTDAPEADGTLAWESTTLVLVRARSGGTTGFGYTYGAPPAARVVDELLARAVTGLRVWDPPGANEAMRRAVRNVGLPGLVAGAVSAVDIALWDLKARLLGLPLADLLGVGTREVPVYGSGGFTTYSAEQQDRQLFCGAAGSSTARLGGRTGHSQSEDQSRGVVGAPRTTRPGTCRCGTHEHR